MVSHSDDWESVPKKSVILSGPRDGGPYKREDFLEGLEFILQGKIKDSVVTFGPLARNSEWYLVLKDQATKDKLLLASYVAVKEVNFRIRSADSSQFIVRVRWAIPFISSWAITKTLDELCKHTHVLSIADEKLSQKGFEGVATGVRSIVSTNSDPVDGTVQRRNGREVGHVPYPMSIINCNANMGGVDLAAQQRSYYGVCRESKKFWTYLAQYIINTPIVNSFVIMMKSLSRLLTHEQHNMTHLKYRMKIVSQLVGGFSSRKRAGHRGVEAPVIEPSHLPGHDLMRMSKKFVCRNCSHLARKSPQGRGVSSTWSCRTCKVALCRDGCLVEYHTRHSL